MLEYRSNILHINNVSALDLVSRFGTPLYVYDAEAIDAQIAKVKRAFAAIPFRPFYAMKANGNLSILRLIRQHGFGCDAVSPGEIHLARRAGFEPDEIWFTCSNVSDEDLRLVGDPRIVINVNSVSEIERCLSLDLPNPMAIRVNPDVGAGHHRDVVTAGGGVKFGIDLAELESARMMLEDAGRRIVGLHAHIGSGVSDMEPLIDSARILLDLAPGYKDLRWINFGGGIGIPYKPGDAEFPIDDFGRELAAFADPILRERGLTAILEPGRYIVGSSGLLLSRVTAKRVSGGAEWIGCDTGFNHLARPSKYGAYHHILNASAGSEASLRDHFDSEKMQEELVVSGNICESGDVFTRTVGGAVITRSLEKTKVGDVIAFCDAGAYGFSMASHYNARLLPSEILVRDREADLIRARQTFEDLIRGME
jgi:diaminopimelate decarboxylase